MENGSKTGPRLQEWHAVIHRDIKPQNILYVPRTDRDGKRATDLFQQVFTNQPLVKQRSGSYILYQNWPIST